MRRLWFLLALALVLGLWRPTFAQGHITEQPASDATRDSLLQVILDNQAEIVRLGSQERKVSDLIRGVYVGVHLRQVEESFSTRRTAIQAGYIVELAGGFLGAIDLGVDTENGVAGLGPTILIPVTGRVWALAGSEIINLTLDDEGIANNKTAALKGGFAVLVKDAPIWGNAYLVISAQYFYRSAAGLGDHLLTESISVPKEAAIENGLWIGLNLYFE